MLNVSCQKQKSCSPFPADSLAERPMEFVGQPAASGACNLLAVPGLGSPDVDDDDSDVVIGIRPRSSPLPRRRSSVTEDDLEFEPPPCGSRRVSFADAKGLSLVQVKKFDTWDVPSLLPGFEPSEGNGKDAEEFFLCPFNFTPPLSSEELMVKVQEQKVELESIDLLPGTTILKGVIRVLNVCFNKAVYVRTTLDSWSSHFDLLAEYIPGSSDGLMDSFSFKLTLVPPFGEQGARVDFCLRYETTVGTFWSNNNDRNYVLFCHQKEKQKEHLNKKSCLKTVSHDVSAVENMSADVSKHGEEVDSKEVNPISGGQSRTSEEDGRKLKTENRRNSSRRSRRKTARMARVKDYFAQRDGAVNDGERDASTPEPKEANSADKHPDTQSDSEGDSKTEVCSSQFVAEAPATHRNTCQVDDKPEKPECISASDSATLKGINLSHSEASPVEGQSINKFTSGDEATDQKQGFNYENRNAADETAIGVFTESSENLVSQTSSFTFGTVVAPLYPQVFGRVGRESEKPALPKVSAADLTQTCLHPERREISCTAAADRESNPDTFQEDVNKPRESNEGCLEDTFDTALPEKEKTSLSMAANDSLYHEILQGPVEIQSSDQRSTNTPQTSEAITNHPQSGDILNVDLLNLPAPGENSHPLGNAQEEILTCEPRNQTGEELELLERTCTQTKTVLDETLAQSETREDADSQQTPFLSHQPPQSVSEHVSDDAGQQASSGGENSLDSGDEASKEENVDDTIIGSTRNTPPEKGKPAEASHGLDPGHDHVSKKETDKTLLETQKETNHMRDGNVHEDETHHSAESEVIGDLAESLTKTRMSKNVGYVDVFVEPKDEARDIKNWEMMVEEEEENVLTEEEESKVMNLSAGDIEAVEKEPRDLMEDEKNEDTIEKKMEEESVEIAASEEEEDIAEEAVEAVEVENKGMIGEEEIVFGKELKYVQGTMKVNVAEETEKMKRLEDEMNDFAEMQEVNISGADIQGEDQIGGEEEMEIDFSDEDQVKPEEENIEEENAAYEEEMLADEVGEVEIVDAESECTPIAERWDGTGRFEERLDVTQNKVEDGLFAPLSNVQEGADRSVTAKENTGEGQNAHIPTEMHLCKEEGESVTHDPSKAARGESDSLAVRGGFYDSTEESEPDRDSPSAESDSDDEVELYMHCLRAVHAGKQASKNQSQDAGLSKRPGLCRRRRLSTPMPSISESLDEENVKHEDTAMADIQPSSSGQEGVSRGVSWWKETFSCSNISKTLLNATLLVVFLLVAYHYDFLACFGLYLITVVWLFYQGDRQPVKNNKIG